MKIILNQDVKHLGEMGDVKNVANGYYRNYLFPHGFAVPYNDVTVAYFESRKEEIAARKEQKRKDSASLKEKLEALNVELVMPAGSNGKLYGAVSTQTVADYLNKNGFEIERKRIEIPGVAIKTTGNYHAVIHLYEAQTAEIKISVIAQVTEEKKESPKAKKEAKAEAPAEATETAAATEAPAAEESTEAKAE
ncbi:MAG: 50S ribosomal protein L9 [Treponema sp.]|nr:50S ribosomal protein L9 [Treponema sp.]